MAELVWNAGIQDTVQGNSQKDNLNYTVVNYTDVTEKKNRSEYPNKPESYPG